MAGGAGAYDVASVVKARIGHFKEIGRAAHTIQIEVRKPSPDAAAVRDASRTIEGLAGQIPSWFPSGSGPQAGANTQARAEIWSDAVGFRARAADLGTGARALEVAAAAGDVTGMKRGFLNLAQDCQGCHRGFRTRDD